MPTLTCAQGLPTADASLLSAVEQAKRHLARNRSAFETTQPGLVIAGDCGHGWVHARDGSLTCLDADGWRAGCSLPLRAARQQLKSMDVAGPVACLLDPIHGAHLRVALDRLKPTQAVLVVQLSAAEMPAMLGAFDFSADVAAHRLWVVAGEDWAAQLRQLFADRPGLSTPMQFIRLSLPDAARLDPVIQQAQAIFREANDYRSATAKQLKWAWRPRTNDSRTAVLTAHHFRLLDDAAVALNDIVAAAQQKGAGIAVAIDADDPASGSTLALVQTATDCGRLLTADVGRGDLPDLLPMELPWLTWITTPRLPSAASAGPNDRLLVADPDWQSAAVAAGWRADAVSVAGWPTPTIGPCRAARPAIAVFADTISLDPPEKLEEFSSHLLLWNSIRQELRENPLAADADAEAFLKHRMRQYGIDDASLDRRLFIRGLIWPAVAQGLVRKLIGDGAPLRLHGEGWDAIDRSHAAGPIASREELAQAAAMTSGVLDVRPAAWRNGLHSLDQPVIKTAGRTYGAVRQDIATAVQGRLMPPAKLEIVSI